MEARDGFPRISYLRHPSVGVLRYANLLCGEAGLVNVTFPGNVIFQVVVVVQSFENTLSPHSWQLSVVVGWSPAWPLFPGRLAFLGVGVQVEMFRFFSSLSFGCPSWNTIHCFFL